MYVYLVNDKIISSETKVPEYDRFGYIGRLFIPWIKKAKELYIFERDLELIKNMYPKHESKHHVVDITKDILLEPILESEDRKVILYMASLKGNKKVNRYNLLSSAFNEVEKIFDNQNKEKEMETKTEKFVVMVEGRTSPTKIHDTYETAEFEAKRLCLKEQLPVYICKAVTKVELNQVTITKL